MMRDQDDDNNDTTSSSPIDLEQQRSAGRKRSRNSGYRVTRQDDTTPETHQQQDHVVVQLLDASTVLTIRGKGHLHNVSSLKYACLINGYQWQSCESLPFDCPKWASWLTLNFTHDHHHDTRNASGSGQARTVDEALNTFEDGIDDVLLSFCVTGNSVHIQAVGDHDDDQSPPRPTVTPLSWTRSLTDIQSLASIQDSLVVVVAGPKGVGKSTFVQLLSNTLLSTNRRIRFLNADLGATSSVLPGPPGLVSWYEITQPLLGEQAAKWLGCHFVGCTTARDNPNVYLHAVESAYHQVQATGDDAAPSSTLVINLDGWVKGLGEQLLQSLIARILPTHLVKIQGDLASRQFSVDATAATVHECDSFASHSLAAAPMSIPASSLRTLRFMKYFTTRRMNSDDEKKPPATVHQNGSLDWSTIVIGGTQDDFFRDAHLVAEHLACQRPYVVSLDSLRIQCVIPDVTFETEGQNRDQVLWRVLNASIVGLCCSATSSATSTEGDINVAPCVGLGLVRSVDPSKRLLYILTMVPPHILQSVNELCLGQIPLPVEMLWRGPHAEAFPYLSFVSRSDDEKTILGTQPMKSRNAAVERKQL